MAVNVIADLKALPGKEDALKSLLQGLVEPTRAEEGNISYDLHQDTSDPSVFWFYETWSDPSALDAHMETPHVAGLVSQADDYMVGGAGGLTVRLVNKLS